MAEGHVTDCIVVVNAGSSSIKFAIHEPKGAFARLAHGRIEGIGTAPRLIARRPTGDAIERTWHTDGFDHRAGIGELMAFVPELMAGRRAIGVGHRVAHGGLAYDRPVRVDDRVLAELEALTPLAPLHQPHNLRVITSIAEVAPHLPQVACFDTAFHRRQPWVAQTFALPRELTETGIRRYGFHGLSYEYIASQLPLIDPHLAEARVVVAHLGNGASLCAMTAGNSIASTMGFTAVDGLVMGTRCGAIDPGVLLYLMDAHGMDARALERLIYQESGLLGVSGISSDMRALRASADPRAREAIELFVYRTVREIGSFAAALGGLDAVVFTGGIGENDAAVRSAVATGCRWLGLILDESRNRSGVSRISTEDSDISAWVIPTDEEGMIARHAAAILQATDKETERLAMVAR